MTWLRTPAAAIRRAVLFFTLFLALGLAPARAAVTITFWSQEFGSHFPHAFFTLHGTPDAGGAPVNTSYGFTLKRISPAALFGNVPGDVHVTKQDYIDRSNAHFSIVLTDAQYAEVLKLVEEWGPRGNSTYNLNRRNCVHFVAEAMRRSGLTVVEAKKLMKKPRSFTQSIADLNAPRITRLEMPADRYYATLRLPRTNAAPVGATVLAR